MNGQKKGGHLGDFTLYRVLPTVFSNRVIPQSPFIRIMLIRPRDHHELLAIGRLGELAEFAGVLQVGRLAGREIDDVDLAEHDVIVDAR